MNLSLFLIFSSIISTILKKFKKVGNRITLFTQYLYKKVMLGTEKIKNILISCYASNLFSVGKKEVRRALQALTFLFHTRGVSWKNKFIGQFFLFPMIINNVSSNVPSDSDSLVRFCLATFILLLLGLFSFISIIGYFVSFYLLQKYDIFTKYPKFVRIIKYYEKMSLYHVIFHIIMCLIVYVFLITINLIIVGYLR